MVVKAYCESKLRQKQQLTGENQKNPQVKASAKEATDPQGAETKYNSLTVNEGNEHCQVYGRRAGFTWAGFEQILVI